MLELVAPEDPEKRLISEDEGRAIYTRYIALGGTHKGYDWEFVFEPITDEGFRDKMIQLYK